MLAAVILVIVAIAAPSMPSPAAPLPDRIIGGVATTIEEFPYQISLRVNGQHICGGSIIDPSTVVTAAHCIVAATSTFSIQAGVTTIKRGSTSGQIRAASKITVHRDYASSTQRNDIAIVHLVSRLTFSTAVNKILLPQSTTQVPDGTALLITGWGSTKEGGPGTSILRQATVSSVSLASCRRAYSGITDSMICASQPSKDTCQGDSGGPLASGTGTGRTLVGITSFGNGCARNGYPGVYTRVSSFRTWIKDNSGV